MKQSEELETFKFNSLWNMKMKTNIESINYNAALTLGMTAVSFSWRSLCPALCSTVSGARC